MINKEMSIGQSNEINERLRFYRALNIFSHALFLYISGEKEVNEGNIFSAIVNLYFSIFHIATASIILLPDYPFEYKKFFLLPNESFSNKKKRLGVKHQEVLDILKSKKEKDSFLKKLYEVIKKAKELRELASYGHYIELLEADDIPYEEISSKEKVFINVRPLALKEYREIAIKPKPFEPINKKVIDETREIHKLIFSFAEYFKKMLNNYVQKDKSSIAKLFFVSWCYDIAALICYVPENIYNEVVKLAKDFCNSISKEHLDAFEEVYYSKEYKKILEAFKEGSILSSYKVSFTMVNY
jgi:uncharacterized protein (UPF0332 family)